jgi:3-deoxy-D-manno-octulosonic acid (KDO) 8-phosphate synthase
LRGGAFFANSGGRRNFEHVLLTAMAVGCGRRFVKFNPPPNRAA